jgi:hypothetical protein
MYLEWKIPSGAGGATATLFCGILRDAIELWSTKWGIPYRTKIHKYTFRCTLGPDQNYDWFNLTWDPVKIAGDTNVTWFRPRLVDPMKLDTNH